nr:hypothetical protein [Roseivivax sediminis]
MGIDVEAVAAGKGDKRDAGGMRRRQRRRRWAETAISTGAPTRVHFCTSSTDVLGRHLQLAAQPGELAMRGVGVEVERVDHPVQVVLALLDPG